MMILKILFNQTPLKKISAFILGQRAVYFLSMIRKYSKWSSPVLNHLCHFWTNLSNPFQKSLWSAAILGSILYLICIIKAPSPNTSRHKSKFEDSRLKLLNRCGTNDLPTYSRSYDAAKELSDKVSVIFSYKWLLRISGVMQCSSCYSMLFHTERNQIKLIPPPPPPPLPHPRKHSPWFCMLNVGVWSSLVSGR